MPGSGCGVAARVIWEVFETVRGAQELKREWGKRGIPQVRVATKRGRWRTAAAARDASARREVVLRWQSDGRRGCASERGVKESRAEWWCVRLL